MPAAVAGSDRSYRDLSVAGSLRISKHILNALAERAASRRRAQPIRRAAAALSRRRRHDRSRARRRPRLRRAAVDGWRVVASHL